MRPFDLAREHGISAQAVRNYERDGFIPAARRSASGYRIYTEAHAAALRAYLSLVQALGYAAAGQIMTALHDDRLDDALTAIDRAHHQLLRDRETLSSVRQAVDHLTAEAVAIPDRSEIAAIESIGDLAHRLGVTTATLRNWEDAGIVVPERDPATGYRVYRATDVRDAELAHLLRRGGYLLEHIAAVVHQIRTAGGTDALSRSLDDWQRKLTARGLAMLQASALLNDYLNLLDTDAPATNPAPS
ncbi:MULTISPECIES: TioE family transcriptional regulator [Actinomadura]|uniref:MerR family DNA-binding transcriptional regulator n=1 Tax=Actinomadura geliboluensis TaxID=882440 RepID=A0A5S4GA01_9ACTN|nr:TioE family transcriptional regulator [Actinomadura geliboluensis]TMR29692.1 MerR family DNA-binding transcriptional regulator [Actinomadura geliboluensis]